MRPSAWQQRVGLTTVNYSSSASRLATALLDPCMLLFLPVARLTPARPLKYQCPVARLTTERPHQCPMPPCCKAHRCKASSVPYMPPCCKASCLDPIMVWSGLCFMALRQLRTLRAVRTHSSAVVCGLVWSVFYTQPRRNTKPR